MSVPITITLDSDLIAWLDYYCSIYGVDRNDASSHLLNGALQTALPNPEWLELAYHQQEELNSPSEFVTSDYTTQTQQQRMSQSPRFNQPLSIQSSPTRSDRFDTLNRNPIVQNRHDFREI